MHLESTLSQVFVISIGPEIIPALTTLSKHHDNVIRLSNFDIALSTFLGKISTTMAEKMEQTFLLGSDTLNRIVDIAIFQKLVIADLILLLLL